MASPGAATLSKLNGPQGVGVDSSGDVYIADTGNNEVEEVNTAGQLSFAAGTGSGASGTPTVGGPATSSHLHSPYDVSVDSSGDLYVADSNNQTVEKVTANLPVTGGLWR